MHCGKNTSFSLTVCHSAEWIRIILDARVLDLEDVINLAEKASPIIRVPKEVGKVAVVPL